MVLGLLALLFANVTSGLVNAVAVKLGVKEFYPLTFSLLRFLLATLIFSPVFYFKTKRLTRKDVIALSVPSLLFTYNIVAFAVGIQFTSAVMSSLLYALAPIIVLIFARILINEKITGYKILGLTIALTGFGFLLYESPLKTAAGIFGTPLGNLFIFSGVLAYSFYTIFTKNLTKKYTPTTTTFTSFVLTSLVLLFVSPMELLYHYLVFHKITYVGIDSLLATAVLSSVVVYFLVQYGIKKTTAFAGSLSLYIPPIFTVISAAIFLHETLTTSFTVGALLVFAGVFIATTYPLLTKQLAKIS